MPASTIEAADALIASGRRLDAIDVLMDLNREHPDPEIERRLVGLRHEAYEDLTAVAGREVWPPEYPDPFPERTGLIEVGAAELDDAVLGGAIRHHGCAMVRGLLDGSSTELLIEDVDEAIRVHREWQAQVADSGDESLSASSPWFTPFVPGPAYRAPNLELARRTAKDRVPLADSPRTLFHVVDMLGRVGLLAHAERYLGTRPVLAANKAAIQRVAPGTLLGWHQETKVFGEPVRTCNAWIALEACGGDAPGLEIYPQRLDEAIDGEQIHLSYALTQESVDRVDWDVAPIVPQFEAGDALLFDEWLVHRTQFAPDAANDRRSLEFWMFAADGIGPHRAPLVC